MSAPDDALWRSSTIALADRLDQMTGESGLLSATEHVNVQSLAARLRGRVAAGTPPTPHEVSMAAATVVRLAHRRLNRLAGDPMGSGPPVAGSVPDLSDPVPASPPYVSERPALVRRRAEIVIRRSPHDLPSRPRESPGVDPTETIHAREASDGGELNVPMPDLEWSSQVRPIDDIGPALEQPDEPPAPAHPPLETLPPPPPHGLGVPTPFVPTVDELAASLRPASRVAAVVAVAVLVFAAVYVAWAAAFLQGRSQRALVGSASPVLSNADIGLDQVVLGGDSKHDLARGPGFARGTGTIGSSDPIIIVGRRTTYGAPFAHLNSLSIGSELTLTAANHPYVFAVVGVDRQSASTPVQITPGSEELILVTGSPWYVASSRLVVVARLIGTAPTGSAISETLSLPALGGSWLDLLAAAVVLAAVSFGFGLVWTSRRRLMVPPLVGLTAVLAALALLDVHLVAGALPKVL